MAAKFMTPEEVHAAQPVPTPDADPLAQARRRLEALGQWSGTQYMGKRWPIGCVALEVTQRCNLDCTACYLSEHSESVKDLPLGEVFRRIEMIRTHYGPGTGVQITGGDPTLRTRSDLIAIVRRIADLGMQPALFTNGIRAKRDLISALADAGLVDIAFHVDMTQQRRGFDSETALNEVRRSYIERARGLPVSVIFNTTVTDGNVEEIPDVVAFFVRNADVVRLASFQLQAATGRGTLGRRGGKVTIESVEGQIANGARADISFDTARIGHTGCNRYALTFVCNGRVHDALDDRLLLTKILDTTARRSLDRRHPVAAAVTFAKLVIERPGLWRPAIGWLARKLWNAKSDLLASRGRVHKLSFFIHNFMDACALDRDRVGACSFMVATHSGPISMCVHNAKRDAFILAPLRMNGGGPLWNPLTGASSAEPSHGTSDSRQTLADKC